MPRLSAAVRDATDPGNTHTPAHQRRAVAGDAPCAASLALGAMFPGLCIDDFGGPNPKPRSRAAASQAAQAQSLALAALHRQRQEQHGPRMYRHPDGSLQSAHPARSNFAVAARRQWFVLGTYCRMVGDTDANIQQTGVSVRHGIRVSHAEHSAALRAIGLQPEYDDRGRWLDWDPAVGDDPLLDPGHIFNRQGPWADLARQVFEAAPFQWHDLVKVEDL